MKFIKPFQIFESTIPIIGIKEFLENIKMDNSKRPGIIEWWKNNRSEIKIHYFPFSSTQPIAGVFLSTTEIAVNEKIFMPSKILLFLALHESRHCDQHKKGIFMAKYYDTVVEDRKSEFLENYIELEKDANDFAINSIRECGLELSNGEERHLRMNEKTGQMVYKMMKSDIEKFKPTDFIDLLKKQIGF